MNIPINANAEYIKVIGYDNKVLCYHTAILIDMNDIARISFGEKVKIENSDEVYNIAIIDWKTPYSDKWQILIDDDGVQRWKDFCSKPVKSVDK